MNCNFDKLHDRRRTGSLKWDFNQKIFGREDILPLWVADMDFQAPQAVVEALVKRAQHGIYGYTDGMDQYYESVIAWMEERHGWQIQRDWIVYSPGIVPALNELVRAFAKPGDKILLQSPVYHPFFQAIKNHGCEVVNNQLGLRDGRYTINFDDLEKKFADGVKFMIFCSPHNPVGRVWEREELELLGKLCLTYDVLLISDEIHGDLIYDGYRHLPFGSLSLELAQHSIVCTAPSKTFNLAGLQTSNIIIPNEKYREIYKSSVNLTGIHLPNVFGATAMEAAYREGRAWLDQLMVYLQGNLDYLLLRVSQELPQIKVIKPEGTYLVWLDFRALGLDPKALQEFLVHKAGVGLNAGYGFGPGGEGFERINIGCPRSLLEEGLGRIIRAVKDL
ncbi:bifunctional PLP-dependent enzyme with beta-cystathionase and maltose regulon repressor activities [Desulfosporosinus acidiphilus SJ4]|uniref:cysteine-S-conjugate beta-lyase n=1 Tax=Desulfosporosinus acidiphilus (strain DSM 22704 / JCM 16185 / SJ4) TaxID=646529 RepID=I4D6B6_DESAJ|nr:PatB family C-S lyase [Desulfosporosinus acidiphilus]AFM41340.1 bifunctional PLP-dependent enzyme with beta-cystathionase and maltose regulon repressor activities [Desulfosporosinus acidiphilus SJ4]